MTAVVGILNRQAVVLAADSAATVDAFNNKRKTINKANKIFTLSKFHPIGVAIYNSSSFMGTPWETIIKMYRKQLGETSFGSVKEYQENFLAFLKRENYFSTSEWKKIHVESLMNSIIEAINIRAVENPNPPFPTDVEARVARVLVLVEQKIDEFIAASDSNPNICPEFNDYTQVQFERDFNNELTRLIVNLYTNVGFNPSPDLIAKIKLSLYKFIRIQESQSNYTGLIFAGYGNSEIYPSIISINVSFAIGDRLRYYVDVNNSKSITNENFATVVPFAQTDVIDTILGGIDPALDIAYQENVNSFIKKYHDEILRIAGTQSAALQGVLTGFDTQVLINELVQKSNEERNKRYIWPLLRTVGYLSKEDLAEMAESLIYLTGLKRRMTSAEESVGGPVDVAVLSKGDGFIWIKRKHYFKPELNTHFFTNYYKI